MSTYRVFATEQIFRVTHIEAKNKTEARAKAQRLCCDDFCDGKATDFIVHDELTEVVNDEET